MKTKKIYVAMITPFDQQLKIDDIAVIRLCHHLMKMDIDGVVVCGTTGEVSALSFDEREHLLTLVKSIIGSKMEIWMGCGTNNTQTTLENCVHAERIGVDGIMLITPYYVRPSQKGLIEHFSTIASCIKTPLMLYNVPKRTGVNLEVRTIVQLVREFDHIVMLKQAHYDLQSTMQIMSECDVQVLWGDDLTYDEALELDVDGIVSVAGQVDCHLLHRMHDAYALGIHPAGTIAKWKQLSRCCFLVSSPSDVKAILSLKGICQNEVRLPLVKVDEDQLMLLKRELQDYL